MKRFQMRQFATRDELAVAAAREWVDTLNGRGTDEPYLVALSGGRVARDFFSAVRGMAMSPGAKAAELFRNVHFFWGDERCVPADDPESNFGIARELLLAPLSIAEEQIHRVLGEWEPSRAVAQASAELCGLAPRNVRGEPVVDMIFLGMGEDGHVASLFPEEPETMMSDPRVFRAVVATKPPPNRITLGYGVLFAARAVAVLASGPGKEAALRSSLEERARTPLGRVLQGRTETVIWSDIKLS